MRTDSCSLPGLFVATCPFAVAAEALSALASDAVSVCAANGAAIMVKRSAVPRSVIDAVFILVNLVFYRSQVRGIEKPVRIQKSFPPGLGRWIAIRRRRPPIDDLV